MGEFDEVNFSIRWNDYHVSKTKKPLHKELLFAVHAYAVGQQCTRSVSVTGYTSIKNCDITMKKDNIYRSDTCFMTKNEWIGDFSRGRTTAAR